MGAARRLEAIQNQARLRFTYSPIAIASMAARTTQARSSIQDIRRCSVSSRGKNRLSAS